MGLDMYLNRFPRYKNVTAKEITAIEDYFDWLKAKAEGREYANCTLKKWCGYDESELPNKETIDYFKKLLEVEDISEEVGYWRKANAIHAWFVDHVQDSIDDCDYHHEVTKEILEELRDTCIKVVTGSVMMLGQVKNGATLVNGK